MGADTFDKQNRFQELPTLVKALNTTSAHVPNWE